MTAADSPAEPILPKDHLLVVADGGGLADALRRRYPGWDISSVDTYLSGVCALTSRPARTVVACVDPGVPGQLSDAVAGLREAAGDRTRLLLCCRPESEPVARAALASGADDYILFPIQSDELDRALGCAPVGPSAPTAAAQAPAATMAELDALADILAKLDSEPTATFQRLAELVQLATGAGGVTVVVHGTVAACGAALNEPVLVEPIESGGRTQGQISLGPRAPGSPGSHRDYSGADVEKVRHYARLTAHLTEVVARHRHWRELALTDELSGLPNRRYLLRFLDNVLTRAEADRSCVTLLIFDIDDFKTYNDICGHEAGDDIIRLAAKLFRRHCREQDLVTRYGGDEFAVVFWDAEEPRAPGGPGGRESHPADALMVLQRFTQDLGTVPAQRASLGLKHLPNSQITISGGLATYPWDAKTRDDLICRADEALLQAKRAGKNRIFTIGQGPAPANNKA